MSFSNLFERTKLKKDGKLQFGKAIDKLVAQGLIGKVKHKFVLNKAKKGKLVSAKIVTLATSFGFASPIEETSSYQKDNDIEIKDYFITGRDLLGALVGDEVLLREKPSKGQSPEGEVVEITKFGDGIIVGVLDQKHNNYYVNPDKMQIPILLRKQSVKDVSVGEKIKVKIVKRGDSHFKLEAEITRVYGDSESAFVAKEAILDDYGMQREFTNIVLDEAKTISSEKITNSQIDRRMDLRSENIFTIDGEDAKDLDDAISLSKKGDIYKLGVHIADVSYYVKPKGALDLEAYNRGTSTYFADEVIPMLPETLSNGICSLLPDEDRLAFSVIIDIDKNGDVLSKRLSKSVIKSRIKGIYSEVNSIFDHSETKETKEKYNEVMDTLFLMKELSDLLEKRRRARGTFDLESRESKILVDFKTGKTIDIVPRKSGFGEGIIESFMLTANEAAASFALEKELPFIHRIHENPSFEKITELKEDLKLLGLEIKQNSDGSVSHEEFNRLLSEAKGTNLETIINYRVLRTMAKAKYSDKPVGHFGLALEKYVHFTSPIRRYPDLVDHRILSEYLDGEFSEKKEKSFAYYVKSVADQSTKRELVSMSVERDCEDVYKAEYMKSFLGKVFDGIIVSATQSGIFVELENTVQGRISVETLPDGHYTLEGNVRLRNTANNHVYSVGDSLSVIVARADMNTGNIDFVLEDEYDLYQKKQKQYKKW